MTTRRLLLPGFVVALALLLSGACGPPIDLSKAVEVTDVFSGWYDDGVLDGRNHLLPTITFKLHNTGSEPIAGVQLIVAFWEDGADGEFDSQVVRGIGSDALAPGVSTDPIYVRDPKGYTLEGARAAFFEHSMFKDFTVKVFASRSGKIVPLGEFKVERRILPHISGRP
jgi:hypothetical protein